MKWRSEVPPERWEDAKFAIQETGGWVKNADAKVTILGAAIGVLFAATIARLADFVHVVRSAPDCLPLYWVLLVGFSTCLAAAGMFIFDALRPRTAHAAGNRFAWPSLAATSPNLLLFEEAGVSAEAWQQAHTLACIASRKYRAFARALISFAVALVSFATLAVWTAVLLTG